MFLEWIKSPFCCPKGPINMDDRGTIWKTPIAFFGFTEISFNRGHGHGVSNDPKV